MDKTNFMEYHMVSRCLFLIGMTLFLWFCWPAVFKRMLNTGNVLGMLLCGMIMFYSARYQKMHQLFADLWQKKPMRVYFLLLAVFCLLAVVLMIAASVAIIGAASNSPKYASCCIRLCGKRKTAKQSVTGKNRCGI